MSDEKISFSFALNVAQLVAAVAALFFVTSKLSTEAFLTLSQGVSVYLGIAIGAMLLLVGGVRVGYVEYYGDTDDADTPAEEE